MFYDIEESLTAEMSTGALERIHPEPWFERIESKFPVSSIRIRWELVPAAKRIDLLKLPREISSEEVARLLEEHMPTIASWVSEVSSPSDKLVWVGDTSARGLRAGRDTMLRVYPILASLPQHSYLLPEDTSWCLNYVMEGELWFAAATPMPPKARGSRVPSQR